MKLKTILTLLIFLPRILGAQEDVPDAPEHDAQKEVLLYGIDEQVLTVLSDLTEEKLGVYNDTLLTVMEETRSAEIKTAIFRLWDDTSYPDGVAYARDVLKNITEDGGFERTEAQAAIVYLAGQQDAESLELLTELAGFRDVRVAAAAVRAIGRIAPENHPEIPQKLLELLQSEDPAAKEDLVAALIVTLGLLRFEDAAEELVLIAEDEGRSSGHRWLACVSVGQIGRSDDFDVIERIFFNADDANLRSYALAGLAEFPDRDVTDILVQALKRDSFWRIRVTAAEKLAGSSADGVNGLLRYKAASDPVMQVRAASARSLAQSQDPAAAEFLLERYQDRDENASFRLTCLAALTENRIAGTLDAVFKIMEELWPEDKERFLEFTCRDLSRTEWDALAPAYERMLQHENWIIQIYGVRGIRRNSIQSLEAQFDTLKDERVLREVRRGQDDPAETPAEIPTAEIETETESEPE